MFVIFSRDKVNKNDVGQSFAMRTFGAKKSWCDLFIMDSCYDGFFVPMDFYCERV